MKKLQSELRELQHRLAEMEQVFAAVMLPVFLAQHQKQSKSRAAK
jgi:hypothetical protein